jgi:hypothetical protein
MEIGQSNNEHDAAATVATFSQQHHYERVQNNDVISDTAQLSSSSASTAAASSSSAAHNNKINSTVGNQHNQSQNHTQPQPEVLSRSTAASRWNSIRLSLGIGGSQALVPTENHNRPAENTQEQVSVLP